MPKKIFAVCFIALLLAVCAPSLAAKSRVKRCRVHGEILKKVRVPIVYGLVFDFIEPDARTELFPNANKVLYGGCVSRESYPKEGKVYYCYQCRVAQFKYEKEFFGSAHKLGEAPENGWWRTTQSSKRLERARQ